MKRASVSRPAVVVAVLLFVGAAPVEERKVGPVPDELRKELALAPFYQQHVSAGGFPVLGSAKVSPFALLEAAYLIDQMLGERQDVRDALVRNKVRFTVMAVGEMTTDVPEHADLRPRQFWDRRARGLGPTPQRPSVSCGEENLLCLAGDPYSSENILIHEFAHAVHEMGVRSVDETFDGRLKRRTTRRWVGGCGRISTPRGTRRSTGRKACRAGSTPTARRTTTTTTCGPARP